MEMALSRVFVFAAVACLFFAGNLRLADAQARTGTIFILDVRLSTPETLQALTLDGYDISRVLDGHATVFATGDERQRLLDAGYTLVEVGRQPSAPPSPGPPAPSEGKGLGTYHDYASITAELEAYAEAHPAIARLFTLGQSVEGKELWAMLITDNPDVEEDEPEFKYVATMHGNEVAGSELCLYFIDRLLKAYGGEPRITTLVDTTAIWVVPLMNPDGHQWNRFNANGFDLNRSFPVFPDDFTQTLFDGEPLGEDGREPEVAHVMRWTADNSFVLSGNFHGGALIVNYPYDNDVGLISGQDAPTPDDLLFEDLSRRYSVHNDPMWNSPSFPDGITNGSEWFSILGGMQDWNYRFVSCFDVTLEVSESFMPPEEQLPDFWADNEESMLSYLEAVHIGVRGLVSSADTGAPLWARVSVAGNAQPVFTDPGVGDYHRLLLPGTYSLTYSALEHACTTVRDITVSGGEATRVDVQLEFIGTAVACISRLDSNPTNAQSVQYLVQFSEPVTGVDTVAPFCDFILAPGVSGASITAVSGSGQTYIATVDTGSGEGDLRLDVVDDDSIRDLEGNSLGGAGVGNGEFTTGESYTIDRTPPLVSIGEPSTFITNSGPVVFPLLFVDADLVTLEDRVDLISSGSATAEMTVEIRVSEPELTDWSVLLSNIAGDGSLTISIRAGAAVDEAGNVSTGTGPSPAVIVDNTAPTIAIGEPSATVTNTGPVTFTVRYEGASSIGLSAENVVQIGSGTAQGSISVLGTGTIMRTVVIDEITGEGAIAISIMEGTAMDEAGNLAPAAGPSSTFEVAPSLLSVSLGAPSVSVTAMGPVTYGLTYSGAQGITLSSDDVILNTTGSVSGDVEVSGTGTVNREVTVSNVTGSGSLSISIRAGTAVDTAGGPAPSAGPSSLVTVLPVPAPPTGVDASDGTYADRVRVIWNPDPLASQYRVFHHTSDDASAAVALGPWQTPLFLDDDAAASGTLHYYWVQARNESGESGLSGPDSGYRAELVTDFSASPAEGEAPLEVQFTDASTADSLDVTGWQWDFGDPDSGVENTSMLQNPIHVYSVPGLYTVSLTAALEGISDREVKENLIEVKAAGISGGPPGCAALSPISQPKAGGVPRALGDMVVLGLVAIALGDVTRWRRGVSIFLGNPSPGRHNAALRQLPNARNREKNGMEWTDNPACPPFSPHRIGLD